MLLPEGISRLPEAGLFFPKPIAVADCEKPIRQCKGMFGVMSRQYKLDTLSSFPYFLVIPDLVKWLSN